MKRAHFLPATGILGLCILWLVACDLTGPGLLAPRPNPATNTRIAATRTAVRAAVTPGPISVRNDELIGIDMKTDTAAFLLPAGSYLSELVAESNNLDGDPCVMTASLVATDHSTQRSLGDRVAVVGDSVQASINDLPAGRYYIHVQSGCAWSITITPVSP